MSGEKQTLVSLTQGFIKILIEANGREVDLSYCEKELRTTKRRLYDVLNVLDGVNFVQRLSKSRVKWLGNQDSMNSQRLELNNPLISDQESELDKLIEKCELELIDLSESELFKQLAFITKEDISRIDPDNEYSVYALCGPPNMTITMKDDYENNEVSHHLICKIENGDGDIDLCSLNPKGGMIQNNLSIS